MAATGLLPPGCTSNPTGPSLNAALVPTCAPWDGPAVALFLTDRLAVTTYPAAPYVSITVYHGVPDILNQRFDVTATSQNVGFAQQCPAQGGCITAQAASVTFGGQDADSTIDVTYRLKLDAGRVISGSARARLYPQQVFCG
ncbi:MAG TPA: hypothetical protein VFU23_08835 [Gemmatimonadales bacterium]|nr:hypothetical protein [Gemmatimonadales bacterium]